MDTLQVFNALKLLSSQQDGETFSHVLDTLQVALVQGNNLALNRLLTEVATRGDRGTSIALDACLDLLCAESASHKNNTPVFGWRCLALNVLVHKPSNLALQRLNDVSGLAGWLSRTLFLDPSDIYVDPFVLSPAAAFDFGPLQAYRHCLMVKARAMGAHVDVLDFTRANVLRPGPSAPKVEQQLVLLGFRDSELLTADLLELLREALPLNEQLLSIEEGQPISFQLLDVFAPWTGCVQTLHSMEALRLETALKHVARRLNLPVQDLKVFAVEADEPTSRERICRISIIAPGNQLVAGLIERGLYESSVYFYQADLLLSRLGVPAVKQIQQASLSQSGPTPEPNQFLVPGKGWESLSPPDLKV